MSGLFSGLTSDELEDSQDRLGGFQAHESDAYDAKIKLAYAGKSTGGATSITVIATLPGDKEYNETIYITNRKGENYWLQESDGKPAKKVPLPGFTLIEDLCLVTTGKPLSEQSTEEKIVKVWNKDEGKELPQSVPVLVELMDKPVYLGILKSIETQMEKDGNGNYTIPTDKTRTVNSIDKVFHNPTKVTVVEAREADKAGHSAEPVFFDKWVEKNRGVTKDKTQKADGKNGRPNGGAPQAGQQKATTSSLFKK